MELSEYLKAEADLLKALKTFLLAQHSTNSVNISYIPFF
jgi:hypothetical protein